MINESKQLPNLNILALDPATTTGYCSEHASGIWEFKLKSYESTGIKFLNFRKKLAELIQAENIDMVVYEKPSGQHFTGVRSHSNFEGVILECCQALETQYITYTSTQIKKFATDKGNAKKPEMIQACKDKYGITPIDDNHADAIHLWYMANNDFKPQIN